MLKKQFKYEILNTINDNLISEIVCCEKSQNNNLTSYTENQLMDMANDQNINFIIVTFNNELIGYAIYLETSYFYEIYKIYTKNNYRKNGIATNMISLLKNKEILLEVDCKNEPAINLYTKNGFISYSTRKKYYKNGNDAILYKKE